MFVSLVYHLVFCHNGQCVSIEHHDYSFRAQVGTQNPVHFLHRSQSGYEDFVDMVDLSNNQ